MRKLALIAMLFAFTLAAAGQAAQTEPQSAAGAYQPKFAGDKAHSDSEFTALAYMRTVAAAEKLYYKKHNKYAEALPSLIGTGSFTRRMVSRDRGDYIVTYKPKTNGYTLTLTPRQYDAAHRSFFVDESGTFRAADTAPATAASEPLS